MASESIPELIEFVLALLALGALAGLLVGLFGAYGGLVIVPVLHPLLTTLGMHNSLVVHVATGISLALVAVTGLRLWRGRRAARSGRGLAPGGWLWAVSAAAVAASVVVSALPSGEMELVFTIAVLAGAVKMLFLGHISAPSGARLVAAGGGGAATLSDDGFSDLESSLGGAFHKLRDAWAGAGRMMADPLAVCAVLAVPGLFGLAAAVFGDPQFPAASADFMQVFGVAVILVTAVGLAPLGAALSGQFPKRVLEVSLGVFLLMLAGEFAYTLLMS
ncbi:hypothetical protein [Azorhizobium]|uniref:Membrane transporter protein n=1 Tax=Azorhizobium caulinodans (strain ATCC 43989 / DSM 5975 / JCM 20966 / LMG 6465 / NBRC 14845 / NCIMB 13405 / ORS 571) TaxID=438753 RepID=A8IDG6_AZOC5|nr:hypothetical protein [Azorhizobium]TDT93388.1 hypothetical protein DFO45_2764 [Azorhizobium sp. AG788]BAF88934.1 hypothetical protein AZC_2936 [Azorhizobium caulinodans ORS 571]